MLTAGARVTLNASGNGTIKFGPADTRGAANWNVTGVIVQTSRPGLAPVPRIQIWLDHEDETGVQGLSYDGSFAQGHCDFTMQRGQQIIATWTGGQSGDIAMLTVTGEKW
jgi:hypothetical protein